MKLERLQTRSNSLGELTEQHKRGEGEPEEIFQEQRADDVTEVLESSKEKNSSFGEAVTRTQDPTVKIS